MSSIDKKAFGISDSLINAVNEALKGGQVKLDKNHNGKIDGQDFKMLRKEELKGGQKNLDKNHNGKLDKQDFKMLRKEETVADKIRGREKMSGNDRKQFEEVEQVDELSGSLAHRAAHGAWIKTDKAKAAFKGQAKAAAQARKFGQYAVKKGYYDAPKKTNEEAQQVDEISTKLAVNYAKGALKSMDTAAAKGSAGHDTFMKRSAGQKLALDKTNPEHKRLKAKVGTSDANAKDAAYKKTVGEDVEQVNELSKATLGSYVNKSAASLGKAGYNAGSTDGTAAKLDPHIHTINKRSTGIKRAVGKLAKEDTQIDELSTNTYHKAAHKAAKRAMGDAQGRSGPIFKKYAGMANKFRDKGMSQEKKEKAMKEETDPGFAEATMDPATKQLAAKKAAIQKTIVQKKMQVMQSKANKQISSMKEAKCTCAEGKKSMTCEVCNDKSMGIKGGKEKIQLNPPLRD